MAIQLIHLSIDHSFPNDRNAVGPYFLWLKSFRPKPFPAFFRLGSSQNSRVLWRSRTCSHFALAVIALSLCGCFKNPAPPRITEVTIGTPIRQDVPVYSQWIGTTVGFIDAEIHSKVTGYLMAQNYQEGSLVKTGDLLFEVDPRPFQAVVDQANAQLNVANAGLTQAKADVDAAKAEIDRAEAAQLKTELDVKRYSPLVKDGTVSQQELDDAVQSNLANLASVAVVEVRYEQSNEADIHSQLSASILCWRVLSCS
jgi:multidrug efflux pump subunit AcrA (membrane-fusion protein)